MNKKDKNDYQMGVDDCRKCRPAKDVSKYYLQGYQRQYEAEAMSEALISSIYNKERFGGE